MQKLLLVLLLPFTALYQTPDNQLTKAEKKDGWVLLFDGKTLADRRTYKNLPENSWEVVNGQLHSKTEADRANEHADLITKES